MAEVCWWRGESVGQQVRASMCGCHGSV